MKTKTLLIAAVMFFALSVSAFAQTAFTVSQETLDRVACCGLSEPTGAIAFTTDAGTPPTVTGTITMRYNLPIANTDAAATAPYRVLVTAVDGSGVLLATQPTLTVINDGSNGLIVVSVPAGYVSPNTITVSNVRVNVSGNCNITDSTVTMTMTSTGNRLTIGETTAITLVKGVVPPLKTPTVTPIAVSIDAGTGIVTGTATIVVQENFLTAFGISSTFPDPSRTQQTLIRLKVSAIPTGVSITFPGTAGIFGTASSAGVFSGAPVTLNASTLPQYVYYVMTAASDPTALDSLSVPLTITTTGPFPLAPGSISISAAMGPFTTATTASLFPQYIDGCGETAAVTFGSISGVLNTILLVPYSTTEVGYDTGLAVANTTLDPGTAAMGTYLQAIPQTGKFTIYFFPKDGSTIDPWVSTDFPGLYGLDATGKLPPGGTFVALLSQVLPGDVTSFGGYLFIVTDFTNAHGEYFISNFDNFTHGALMLVVNDINRVSAGRTQEQGLDH